VAIAVVQTEQESTVFANSATLAFASAPSATDLIVAILYYEGTETVTAPSGFTLLAEVQSLSPNYRAVIYYKYNDTGNSYVYSWTTSAIARVGGLTLSGVDSTTPVDVAGSGWDSASYAALTITGITTVTDAALHMLFSFNSDNGQTTTALTGYSRQLGASSAMGTWTKEVATAGATGSQTVDHGTEFVMRGFGAAWKPSGGGGGPRKQRLALLGVG